MYRFVAMCCFCDKLRDDAETEAGRGRWRDFRVYMAEHMLKPEEVIFSHTYCPGCLSYYKEFLGSSLAVHEKETERKP